MLLWTIGIGRGGKSSNIKNRIIADWELEEYRRELQNQRNKDHSIDKDVETKS